MPASRSKNDRSKPKTIEVCPELNELDIGEAIASLLNDPERRGRMSQRGLERVQTGYSVSLSAKEFDSRLLSLLQGRP